MRTLLCCIASAGIALTLGACGSSSSESDGGPGDDGGEPPSDASTPTCDAAVCEPGATTQTAEGCPLGEVRRLECNDSCEYEEVSGCAPESCDRAGAVEMLECGLCGTQERFCNADGVWEYGSCKDEGGCVPGETRSQSCGMCGTQRAQCTSECEWRAAESCNGEGECSPGETETTTSECPAGEERLVECTSECSFVEVEGCSPPYDDVMLLFDLSGDFWDEFYPLRPAIVDEVVTPLIGSRPGNPTATESRRK